MENRLMPEAVITSRTDPLKYYGEGKVSLVDAMQAAFRDAMDCKGKLAEPILSMEGMSGLKYRYFINNFVQYISNPRYLEVGSWAGSTLCSAIYLNKLTAVAIDNWSQFGGPVNKFFNNVSQSCSLDTKISIINKNFRDVNFRELGRFNIYLFDGPHEMQDQYDGLAKALDCLDYEFLFVVDDWNWEAVRTGTMAAIADLGLIVMASTEIRTTTDNSHPEVCGFSSEWHNGYFISVLKKHYP